MMITKLSEVRSEPVQSITDHYYHQYKYPPQPQY